MRGNFPRPDSGVSIVELALLLPLIILLIAGMVDLGLALREAQVISEASRYGARLGSSRFITCEQIEKTAESNALRYLKDAGLNETKWQVDAAVLPPLGDDPAKEDEMGDVLKFRSVQVSITRNTNSPSCILCVLPILNTIGTAAKSTFLLEPRPLLLEPLC